MIEIGAVASKHTNLTLRSIDAPKGAPDVAEISMSFDDFIDMVNPLQHIPVLSSVYRAIAGEDINPISRVAGDALYGGVFGLASAGLSAASALGDEVFAAANDGQSASEIIIAALSGGGEDSKIQVAENSVPAAAPVAVPAETAVAQQATEPKTEVAQAAPAVAPTQKLMTVADASASPAVAMTLASSKTPFGSVTTSPAFAQQDIALPPASDGRNGVLQAQRSMRNNRFATAAPAATVTPPIDTAKAEPETQAAMQTLLDDLRAMKAIGEYQNAAQNSSSLGETVNIVY